MEVLEASEVPDVSEVRLLPLRSRRGEPVCSLVAMRLECHVYED
jgi:hypothetical protein